MAKETSFDFEQDGLGSNNDDSHSEDWGSEFDGDDDFDEYEVDADVSGQMSSVNMMHKAFWERLNVIKDEQIENDSTGRYAYVRACQHHNIRPSV